MADLAKAKKMNVVAYVLTVVVLLLVGLMRRPEMKISLPEGVTLDFLPAFHSTMNVLCAISLIMALVFVKRGQIDQHRKAVYAAMGFSVLFLLSYVAYHFTHNPVPYMGSGIWRPIYFTLLISHIALAAISFPFILFTFIRAYTGQIERHRKMAKWVFPIWLYVAISGPLVYLMLALAH